MLLRIIPSSLLISVLCIAAASAFPQQALPINSTVTETSPNLSNQSPVTSAPEASSSISPTGDADQTSNSSSPGQGQSSTLSTTPDSSLGTSLTSPTGDAEPTSPGPSTENVESSVTSTTSPTGDAEPTSPGPSTENVESSVTSTTPTTSSGSPVAPVAGTANSTLTGSSTSSASTSSLLPSPAPEVTSAGQGGAFPSPVIPIQTPTLVPSPVSDSVDSQVLDPYEETPSSAEPVSLGSSALETPEPSTTPNTVGGDSMSATPASLTPGPTNAPPSTQKPADSITTASLTSSSSVSIAIESASTATSTSTVSPTRGGTTSLAPPGSQYIIESKTLSLGSSVEIGAGSSTLVVELRTATDSATEVVVGSGNSKTTSTLTSAGAAISLPVPLVPTEAPPQLSLAGTIYPANSLTQYSLASDLILTPGGVATVDGTEISLATSASIAVVGSSTQILSAPEPRTTTIVAGIGGEPAGSSGVGGATPSGSSDVLATVNAAGGWRSEMSNGLRWMWLIGIIVATGYLGGVL